MNKISIVTGGGSGIGRAICLKLADQNKTVLATGRRENKLLETQKASANPGNIKIIPADISLKEGRKKIIDFARNFYIEFLVHNAGSLGRITNLLDMPDEIWHNVMAVNLDAPLFLTRDLHSQMVNSRVLHTNAGWGAYSASKAALYSVYKTWNAELKDSKFIVGSVRPGIVDTDMQAELRKADIQEFPRLQRFRDLYENSELEKCDRVAKFIYWILTETSDEQFCADEWDIRDDRYVKVWDK